MPSNGNSTIYHIHLKIDNQKSIKNELDKLTKKRTVPIHLQIAAKPLARIESLFKRWGNLKVKLSFDSKALQSFESRLKRLANLKLTPQISNNALRPINKKLKDNVQQSVRQGAQAGFKEASKAASKSVNKRAVAKTSTGTSAKERIATTSTTKDSAAKQAEKNARQVAKATKTYADGLSDLYKTRQRLTQEQSKLASLRDKGGSAWNKDQIKLLDKQDKAIQKHLDNVNRQIKSMEKNKGRSIGAQLQEKLSGIMSGAQDALTLSKGARGNLKSALSPYAKLINTDGAKIIGNIDKLQTQLTTKMNGLRKILSSYGKDNISNSDRLAAQNQIKNIQGQIGTLSNLRSKIPTSGVLGSEQIAKQYDSATKSVQNMIASTSKLQAQMTGKLSIANTAQNDAVAMNKLAERMSTFNQKYGHNLQKNQQLYNKFLNLQEMANNGSFKSVGEGNRMWAQFQTQARKAGVEIDSFGAKLQRTFGSRIRSATAGMGVFMIQSALRGIVDSAKEVDTAMTELKKVTFETDSVYEKFLNDAGGRAQKIGATLKDTVSATADFARLGYNIDEATKLADSALIYKNVGDDVDTIDDASKAIISTMQGFNIEAENSMEIVDKFDWVADNYASSAGDIGQITQRSAAAMAAAGNDLSQTIALGVAANEVQQDKRLSPILVIRW